MLNKYYTPKLLRSGNNNSNLVHIANINSYKTRTFSNSGIYVIKDRFHGNEMHLVINAKPLSVTSFNAHRHLDDMSFTLSIGMDFIEYIENIRKQDLRVKQ